MRHDETAHAQFRRTQAARQRVVLEAEALVAAGGGTPELREALLAYEREARAFEEIVQP